MRRRHSTFALLLALAVPALGSGQATTSASGLPLTRPERTDWMETSRYEDVIDFLDQVVPADARMHRTSFGYTREGRSLPLVVVGNGLRDGSPEAVRESGKLRVWLQGNIHGGEVEGKEVLQRMLRTIAEGGHGNWLESVVLLVAPIYNADGNERILLTNRGPQHGPLGGMGQRPNSQDFDLNRDHMKLASPEARSLVGAMNRYDPHVSVDLHTTNGTRHAYHLTYSPPLHPDTPAEIDDFLRNELLPAVTETILEEDGWHYYHYGNVPGSSAGGTPEWRTFDYRPRFNTNYIGLRNRIAILSEAYSYAIFQEREIATYRFVEEILDYIAPRAEEVKRIVETAGSHRLIGTELSLVAEPKRTPGEVEILMGDVIVEKNPFSGAPIWRRADVIDPVPMAEYIAFQGIQRETVPASYAIPVELEEVIELLEAHGVEVEPLDIATMIDVEYFVIEAAARAERPFQGRNERTVAGEWRSDHRLIPEGTAIVRMDQPLARLIFHLLEPAAADGFVNWAVLDEWIDAGKEYPIWRTHAFVE